MLRFYERTLAWVLEYPPFTLAVLLITIGLTSILLMIVPKGFFPQQDNGTHFSARIQGAQDISFQAMQELDRALRRYYQSRSGR